MKIIARIFMFTLIATVVMSAPAFAGPVGDAMEEVGDAVGSTVSGVGDSVGGLFKDETPDQSRAKIDQNESAALKRLLAESKPAKYLFDKAYGHAVFDTRKFSILITTGFGAGVAVQKEPTNRTYMKMATGGLNIGAGVQFFQLVFLFEDKKSFDAFVENGWEAGGSASAVFGKNSVEGTGRFVEGMAVYQLSETGLMLDMNIAGTKYWKDGDLNA